MEANFITQVFLPIAVAIIMLGLGLSLTISDFKRVVLFPKAASIGAICQLLLLPLVGFIVASIVPLQPELAVGLVLLASCPGGASSNLMVYLAKGDIALSVTLTAIISFISVFTIPFLVNMALFKFMGANEAVQLPLLKTTLQIFAVTAVPIIIGMIIKSKFPIFADKCEAPVKIISMLFLFLVIFGAIIKERAGIMDAFQQVGLAVALLNISTMLVGYAVSKLGSLNKQQTISITIEVGIQNGTIAIGIASSPLLLNNPTMAITPAIYGLFMYVTGGIFIYFINSKFNKQEKIKA